MAGAVGIKPAKLPATVNPTTLPHSLPFQVFRNDGNAVLTCDWSAVREIAALPILCLSCLRHTLPSLAGGFPSDPRVRRVGGARVGLERIS